MIPVYLRLQNFGAHADTEVDFALLGESAVLVGRTGSGKSSILDGILYALTGKTRDALDEQIRRGQQHMTDEFRFRVGGGLYRIIRKRTRAKSKKASGESVVAISQWDGEGWGEPLAPAQERIEQLIHGDYEVLTATSICMQGDSAHLVGARPAERLKIMRRLLRAERYGDYRKTASAEVAVAKVRQEGAAGALAEAEQRVAGAEEAAQAIAPTESEIGEQRAEEQRLVDVVAQLTAEIAEGERAAARRAELERAVVAAQHDLAAAQQAAQQALNRRAIRRETAGRHEQARSDVAAYEQALVARAAAEQRATAARAALDEAVAVERAHAARRAELVAEETAARAAVEAERAAVLAERKVEGERCRGEHDGAAERLKRAADAWTAAREARSRHASDVIEARAGVAQLEGARESLAQAEANLAAFREGLAQAEQAEREHEAAARAHHDGARARELLGLDVRRARADLEAAEARAKKLATVPFGDKCGDAGCELVADATAARGGLPELRERLSTAMRALAEIVVPPAPAPIAPFGYDRRHAVAAAERHVATDRKLVEQQAHWPGVLERLARAEQELPPPVDDGPDVCRAERDAVARAQRALEAARAAYKAEIPPTAAAPRLAAAIAAVAEHGPTRSADPARIEAKQADDAAAARRADAERYADAPTRLLEIERAVAELPALEAEVDAAGAAVTRAEERHLAARVAVMAADPGAVDGVRARRAEAQRQLDGIREVVAELSVRLTALRGQAVELEAARADLAERRAAAQATEQEVQRLQTLEKIYQEIPVHLMSAALPAIEQAGNAMLADLGFAERMRLDDRDEAKNGNGKDSLEVWIQDPQGYEAPYLQYSGGEKFSVDLAFRDGMGQLLAARSGATDRPMLIIDEGWGSLDPEYIKGVAKVLARIIESRRYSIVLAVSHVPELVDVFPRRVQLTKTSGGVSRLEVAA